MTEGSHADVELPASYREVPLSSKAWFVALWLLLIFPVGLIMLSSRKTYFRDGERAVRLTRAQKALLGVVMGLVFSGAVYASEQGTDAADSESTELVGLSAAPQEEREALATTCGAALHAYDSYVSSGDTSFIAVADQRAMDCHDAASQLAATLEKHGSAACAEWVLGYPQLVDDLRNPTLQIRGFLSDGNSGAYAMDVSDEVRQRQRDYLQSGAGCLSGGD